MASQNPKRKNLPDLDALLSQIREDIDSPQQTQRPSRIQPPRPKGKMRGLSSPLRPANNTNNSNNCCNCCDDMLGMLSIINDSASKILDALKAEHLLDKKTAERLKQEKEQENRREKERLLESSGRRMSNTFRQTITPLKNIFDSIFKFILFTIAGRLIGKVIKWFSDPANEKKIKSLSRFLSDWWPALLGAFVLFGTRFGAAIRSTVKLAVSTILHLKKIGIPGILLGLKKFGKAGLILGGVAGTALLAGNYFNQLNKEGETSEEIKKQAIQTTQKTPPTPAFSSGGFIPKINLFPPEEQRISDISYAEGGPINESSGIAITGAGPDTQLIAAQPGEIVISKAAVDKFGADTFLRMNLMAGSSNKPKFANNIQLAQQGGMIGKNYSNITMPNLSLNANIQKTIQPPTVLPNIRKPDYNMLLALSSGQGASPVFNSERNNSIYNQLSHNSFSKNSFSEHIKKNKFNIGSNSSSGVKDKKTSTFIISKDQQMRMAPTLGLSSQPDNFLSQSKSSLKPPGIRTVSMRPMSISETQKSESNALSFAPVLAPSSPSIKTPIPRPRPAVVITELPPIDMRKTKALTMPPGHSEVPDFSAIPRITDRYGDSGTLATYGIRG
jgi:hypothetical protein